MVINEVTVLVWIVCGIACYAIARMREVELPAVWFTAGIVLGPLGVLYALAKARPPTDEQV